MKKKDACIKASSEITFNESNWSVSQLKALITRGGKQIHGSSQKNRVGLLQKWAEFTHQETPLPSPGRDEGDIRGKNESILTF